MEDPIVDAAAAVVEAVSKRHRKTDVYTVARHSYSCKVYCECGAHFDAIGQTLGAALSGAEARLKGHLRRIAEEEKPND